jgi:hypothetical protein
MTEEQTIKKLKKLKSGTKIWLEGFVDYELIEIRDSGPFYFVGYDSFSQIVHMSDRPSAKHITGQTCPAQVHFTEKSARMGVRDELRGVVECYEEKLEQAKALQAAVEKTCK